MTNKKFDILVPGLHFCDIVFTGLSEVPRLGADVYSQSLEVVPGGTFYIVHILHKLGLDVGWITDFGNDFFSNYMLEIARNEKIDLSLCRFHDEARRVVAASFSFQQDRGFVSYVDKAMEFPSTQDLEELDFNAILLPGIEDWVHISALATLKKRNQITVFIDCQHSEINLQTPGVADGLKNVDIFAPNEREAIHFTGAADVRAALNLLAEIVPLVVIKRGAKGAIAKKGDKIWEVPPIKVKVNDTTGAGDSFNAGFLYAHLKGLPVEMCLKYGNVTGGLSVTRCGPMECLDIGLVHQMVNDYPAHIDTEIDQ